MKKTQKWSEYLKVCMVAKGYTQETLAKRANVSRPTISEYLAGNQVPTIEKFEQMVEALGGSMFAYHKFKTME